jgi:TonB-dependent SusC/RagA subfamily outer membrane receptor
MNKVFFSLNLLFALIIVGRSSAYAQTDQQSFKTLADKVEQYAANRPTEKAYLQFDKPYYAIGDTIYFKAYVTIGPQHRLSALSGILHIDLIGPDNKLIRPMQLQIVAGTTSGDLVLSDTLKRGTYRVRAYTTWMRNEGEDTFFEQVISVGSTVAEQVPESGIPKSVRTQQKRKPNQPDVQFMPEGGSLIAGNYSKIAFKAVGADGLGRDIKGTITDEDGYEVTSFASTHLGMGSFNLVPQRNKSYKANVTYADGTILTRDLPKAVNNGYTININNSNAEIRVRITAGAESSLDKLILVAQSGGTVYFAAENQHTEAKFFSTVIPKSKFPTGIIQFTLFSPAGEPLNERLVFVNNHDELKLNLNTDKQSYQTRQKVTITLNAKDKEEKAVTGSFSVAITDESKVPQDTTNENNILSDILLTSELKGTIEQPAYYFNSTSENANTDLDNLLLTQGYRHFEWKNVLIAYQPEKAIAISGTVKKSGKPVVGAKVSLVSKAGGFFMIDTTSDTNGRFTFKNLAFADSTKFVVQSKVNKGQDDVTLELDSVLPPRVTINAVRKQKENHNADLATYITSQKQFYEEQQKYGINKHAITLKEVHIESRKEPLIAHSENLNGAGQADQVLSSKDLEKFICGRIIDCLQGVITGVKFGKDGYPYSVRQGKMSIMIDGIFVDADDFANLHTDDIEAIEVLISTHFAAIYGSRAANGVLIVTTKRAHKVNSYYREAPGVIAYTARGFYKAREFYSPQYDNPKTNTKMADLRSTIYWQPNVITDKDGKASFSYFNADGKGTYRVVIEGIDANGNLGRQVYRYKVE